ncbi:MAG: PIN domain-containing protein [archaeon]
MLGEFITDTNILAYVYDDSEPEKREKCFNLVKTIFESGEDGCVSNQILAELFVTLTKNINKPLNIEDANTIVDSFIVSGHWDKINYTHKTVEKAIGLSGKYKIHFWDALIAATMISLLFILRMKKILIKFQV